MTHSSCLPTRRHKTNDHKTDETFKDKRDKIDLKQFIFDGLEETTAGKQPGEVHGQQFVIQNCKKSNLYIFDQTASVTIDDCTDCSIFIGPCKGSVFIRDCKNCRFMLACQQFRTRDCENMEIFIFCQTKPIIEESKNIRFGCLQIHYEQLLGQFEASEMSPFSNNWSAVHDFTPSPGNYTLLPQTIFSIAASGVPKGTQALRKRCLKMIRELEGQEKGEVIQTWEVTLQPADAERVLGSSALKEYVKNGPTVALQLSGSPDIREFCREYATLNGWGKELFVVDEENTKNQLKIFNTFIDMQLGV